MIAAFYLRDGVHYGGPPIRTWFLAMRTLAGLSYPGSMDISADCSFRNLVMGNPLLTVLLDKHFILVAV